MAGLGRERVGRQRQRLGVWYLENGRVGSPPSSRRRAPVPVGGIEGVIEVAAGGEHACARNDQGKLYCWGNNNFGQLGLDDQVVRFTPVEVTRF